jgi:hypothetical protein
MSEELRESTRITISRQAVQNFQAVQTIDRKLLFPVIPAQAGIQAPSCLNRKRTWMPAFAGMTNFHFASRRVISTVPERTLTRRLNQIGPLPIFQ